MKESKEAKERGREQLMLSKVERKVGINEGRQVERQKEGQKLKRKKEGPLDAK